MDLGITKKVALVTAASQGLGKAAALALARECATVVICSRRKREIEAAAKEIANATESEVLPLVADLSQAQAIDKLMTTVRNEYGTVHILVSNVGGPPTGDIVEMMDETWQKGFESTFMSTVRLIRAALPMMVKQNWGRIITITSIAAKEPITDLLISSSLRPGIQGLTKVIANKYANHSITINTVAPGMILTARQEELMNARSAQQNMSREQYMANAAKDIPAGRMGKPEEIGDVVAFLASEQASYINGSNLLVDGGLAKGIH